MVVGVGDAKRFVALVAPKAGGFDAFDGEANKFVGAWNAGAFTELPNALVALEAPNAGVLL